MSKRITWRAWPQDGVKEEDGVLHYGEAGVHEENQRQDAVRAYMKATNSHKERVFVEEYNRDEPDLYVYHAELTVGRLK